jgi:hypothetical protein
LVRRQKSASATADGDRVPAVGGAGRPSAGPAAGQGTGPPPAGASAGTGDGAAGGALGGGAGGAAGFVAGGGGGAGIGSSNSEAGGGRRAAGGGDGDDCATDAGGSGRSATAPRAGPAMPNRLPAIATRAPSAQRARRPTPYMRFRIPRRISGRENRTVGDPAGVSLRPARGGPPTREIETGPELRPPSPCPAARRAGARPPFRDRRPPGSPVPARTGQTARGGGGAR